VNPGIRRALTLLLLLWLGGTFAELTLFGHWEDPVQLIPLGVVPAAVASLIALSLRPGTATRRAFQLAMCLLVATGAAGVALHYRANLEFQREVDPGAAQWLLMSKALHAKAPPALAPASLTLIGSFGLVLAQGHLNDGRTRGR